MQRRNDNQPRRNEEEGMGNMKFRQNTYHKQNEDEIWDDDFTKKKFQFGHVIERDQTDVIASGVLKLNIHSSAKTKENYDRGKIIRTTNIDTFLNCDDDE